MYKSLQVCRALAGLFVTLYHLGGAFGSDKYFGAKDLASLFSFGHHSLIFFFVLSGFIIVHAHREEFDRPGRFLPYWTKRCIRIYPAYVLILLAVYFTARAIPALSNTVPHDLWVMVKTLLLLPQDREVVGGTGAPVIIAAWSMQYELVFYAVVGLFILNGKLGWAALLVLAINFIDCRWNTSCVFPRSFAASDFIFPFCFGAASALALKSRLRVDDPWRIAWFAISAIAFLRGMEVIFDIPAFTNEGVFEYGLPSAVLIFSLVRAEQAGLIRVHRYWTLLAASSYVLFIVHFPLISALSKLALKIGVQSNIGIGVAFVLIFAICVMTAVMFHLYIERPIVGYLLQRRAVRQSHAAVAEPS